MKFYGNDYYEECETAQKCSFWKITYRIHERKTGKCQKCVYSAVIEHMEESIEYIESVLG